MADDILQATVALPAFLSVSANLVLARKNGARARCLPRTSSSPEPAPPSRSTSLRRETGKFRYSDQNLSSSRKENSYVGQHAFTSPLCRSHSAPHAAVTGCARSADHHNNAMAHPSHTSHRCLTLLKTANKCHRRLCLGHVPPFNPSIRPIAKYRPS